LVPIDADGGANAALLLLDVCCMLLLAVCAKIGDDDEDITVLLNKMPSVIVAMMIDLLRLEILWFIIAYCLLVLEQRGKYFGFSKSYLLYTLTGSFV
jgi:hypothetical protein